ncbi:FAD/FMN-containing dehydrogenase [Kribbella amoyensis]|uniref:FAD/FMN-containing dehydrogenase n=1 Tax=Kribbella amoyensis TaxID=996641 RepID=A0A561BXV2_9ACTN|nr:FAD-binding oxidoreductase [Kribbella amoyensis]TWD83552.1 FAD/FMN-containing dehydrogenase [Kribbella amoyensis]
MSTTAADVHLDPAALDALVSDFHGELIRPADPAFDARRKVWNGAIDRRPALIARCTGVADIRAALAFARRTGLTVAVRGGGHSFPGHSTCDGGLLVDLGLLKGVRVDPVRRTVRAQAGVLLGELDRETQAFGLATPSGIVTHTGVAGLTLGGGIGWLMRKYGLSVDNLLSVDLVTAEGELVTADEEANTELFWGVRGGGGNFGIVTEFEFRLHPVGPILPAGPVIWPMESAVDLLHFYRDWITAVPDELTTAVIQRWLPPLPTIPAEHHGRPVVMVLACYAGPIEDGERVLAPLKAFAPPLLDLCAPRPYLALQSMFDASYPHGRWYHMRSCDVDELSDEVIDIAVERGRAINAPWSSYPIFQLGGAVARVAPEATAFGGRSSGHTFNFVGSTVGAEGFPEQRDWARQSWQRLAPHQSGVYVNFLSDEGEDRIRSAYGAAAFDRLKALKRHYDPANLFHLNQNISPA